MAAADRHKEEDHMQVLGDKMTMVKHLSIEISRNQVS